MSTCHSNFMIAYSILVLAIYTLDCIHSAEGVYNLYTALLTSLLISNSNNTSIETSYFILFYTTTPAATTTTTTTTNPNINHTYPSNNNDILPLPPQ